jgi:hypothetical protein
MKALGAESVVSPPPKPISKAVSADAKAVSTDAKE